MTEAEWLACENLPRLIKSQRQERKDRKLRLFACACARRVWDRFSVGPAQGAVEIAERFADGNAGEAELDGMYQTAHRAWFEANLAWTSTISTGMAVVLPDASGAALYASTHAPAVAVPSGTPSRKTAIAAERQAQLVLFRDIFGNPFRPVALDPVWRTSNVVALARGIYEERAFDRMPILADALQDAGCDNDDVLNHCRDPQQVHVRGCWVVDLLLGRE